MVEAKRAGGSSNTATVEEKRVSDGGGGTTRVLRMKGIRRGALKVEGDGRDWASR